MYNENMCCNIGVVKYKYPVKVFNARNIHMGERCLWKIIDGNRSFIKQLEENLVLIGTYALNNEQLEELWESKNGYQGSN